VATPHLSQAAPSSEFATLDARLADLRARFPAGIQAGLAGYDSWLRNELAYSSNAIDGNTLTACETRLVVERGAVIPGRTTREHDEARGHADAWDYAVTELSGKRTLSPEDIAELHRRILAHSTPPASPPRHDLEEAVADPGAAPHPVLRAAHAHLVLLSLHPFASGNGRTARMLMNTMLVGAGYVAIPIYPADLPIFLAAFHAAQAAGGDHGASFCEFIRALELREIQRFFDGGQQV
jgi:Fic family protein